MKHKIWVSTVTHRHADESYTIATCDVDLPADPPPVAGLSILDALQAMRDAIGLNDAYKVKAAAMDFLEAFDRGARQAS